MHKDLSNYWLAHVSDSVWMANGKTTPIIALPFCAHSSVRVFFCNLLTFVNDELFSSAFDTCFEILEHWFCRLLTHHRYFTRKTLHLELGFNTWIATMFASDSYELCIFGLVAVSTKWLHYYVLVSVVHSSMLGCCDRDGWSDEDGGDLCGGILWCVCCRAVAVNCSERAAVTPA